MRWFINVLKAMLVCLGLLIGAAFLLPGHRHVERSLDIPVSAQRVWGFVADPRQWTTWAPWSFNNPAMRLRLVSAEAPRLLTYTLTLVEMGAQARGALRLESTAAGTRVTWSLDADLGLDPMARWLGLRLERTIGAEFEQGLKDLALMSKA